MRSPLCCYIGVGHDDTEHLADRCLDQSFSTPTHFGDALADALNEYHEMIDSYAKRTLEEVMEEFERENRYVPSSLETPPRPRRRKPPVLVQIQGLKSKVTRVMPDFSRPSPIRYYLMKGKYASKKILKLLFWLIVIGCVLCTVGLILLFTFF